MRVKVAQAEGRDDFGMCLRKGPCVTGWPYVADTKTVKESGICGLAGFEG